MGRGTRAKQPSALFTSAPQRTHFRGTRFLSMHVLLLSRSTWPFKARQWHLSLPFLHYLFNQYWTCMTILWAQKFTKWMRSMRWETKMCCTNRSSMGEAGTHKALLQYSRSNCYQLPLQSMQEEAIPEGRVKVSSLALGLSPCLGRIFILADFGESSCWVGIHNVQPCVFRHTNRASPQNP